MEDNKISDKNEKELETLRQTISIFGQDLESKNVPCL